MATSIVQIPIQTFEKAEGRVVGIKFKADSYKDGSGKLHYITHFDLNCSDPKYKGYVMHCRCITECFIRIDDLVAVRGNFDTNMGMFLLAFPPKVDIPGFKEDLVKIFMKYLSANLGGNRKFITQEQAGSLYDKIATQASLTGIPTVSDYIDKYAVHVMEFGDDSCYSKFQTDFINTPFIFREFMKKWYNERFERLIFLSGLTREDVANAKEIGYQVHELVKLCKTCPYKIPSLSPLRRAEIVSRIEPDSGFKFGMDDMNLASYSNHLYNYVKNGGNTCIVATELQRVFNNFGQYLNKPDLLKDYGMILEGGFVYLLKMKEIEDYLVKYLTEKVKNNKPSLSKKPSKLEVAINTPMVSPFDAPKDSADQPVAQPILSTEEEYAGIYFKRQTMTDTQKKAVKMALYNDISIIDGGPGTGKTTIIDEIVGNLDLLNISYMVVSFTGKAVSRVRSVIKRDSVSTMHRMIASGSSGDDNEDFEHLIIDEISMVSMLLIHDFVRTFRGSYKITVVGDKNQLEPIAWGHICRQLMKIKGIPRVTLDFNHRSSVVAGMRSEDNFLASNIITMGRIMDGLQQGPFKIDYQYNIVHFSPLGTVSEVEVLVNALFSQGVPKSSLVVISPYKEYCQDLNNAIQAIYNRSNYPFIKDKYGVKWMLHDRLMMRYNNYDINVMNGEEGVIVDVIEGGRFITIPAGTTFTNGHAIVNGISLTEGKNGVEFATDPDNFEADTYGNKKLRKDYVFTITGDSIVVQFDSAFANPVPVDKTEADPGSETPMRRIFAVATNDKDYPDIKFSDSGDSFDDKNVPLNTKMLRHSSAITAHKSQGSEWPYVIMFIPNREKETRFITSNMLYTIMSRAKMALYVIGNEQFINSRCNFHPPERVEMLGVRVNQALVNGC